MSVVIAAVAVGLSEAVAVQGPSAALGAHTATVVLLAGLMMRGKRRHDALRRTRALLLGALGTVFVAGLMPVVYAAVSGHRAPSPWWNDAVALAYVPLTVAALLCIGSASRSVGYRARAAADGALAACSLWYLLLALGLPAAQTSTFAGLAKTVALAYPVGDVFVVATALTVLARCRPQARQIVGWMVVGLAVAAGNDVWGALDTRPSMATWHVMLFQAALLLLLGAAASPAVLPDGGHEQPTAFAWALGALPFLPLACCMAATTRLIVRGDGMPNAMLVPALMIAIALSFRQLAGARDRRRLVARLQEREHGLQAALRRDDLTGLANRRGLHEALTAGLRDPQLQPVTVGLLDLNDFKLINDNHGHGVGDAVLVALAQRLIAAVRGGDVVARLGGDEFAVLAISLGESERDELATRLVDAFEAPITVGTRRFHVSTSIGVVTAEPGDSAEDVLSHADAAMYRAKDNKQRTSTVTTLAPADRGQVSRRLRIQEEIGAPDLRQFYVAYQPVVDLETGSLHGLEALVRWRHPELGDVAPDEFIVLAEQADTISGLGDLVLRTAIADLTALTALDPARPLVVSVNVSPRQLSNTAFADSVLALLAESGLEAGQLALEITEQAFEADIEALSTATTRLIGAGVSVAVDDFGTGYSSMRYLHRLPVNIMKIDRTFVAEMTTRTTSGGLVAALATMADALGLQLIAEGIENVDQLQALRHMGCQLGQGFLFGPAQSIEAIEPLIRARHHYPTGAVSLVVPGPRSAGPECEAAAPQGEPLALHIDTEPGQPPVNRAPLPPSPQQRPSRELPPVETELVSAPARA